MIFSNVRDASATTLNPEMIMPLSSPDEAYSMVMTSGMPTAYVAIRLDDSDWSNGLFTIGDATSNNMPLRTGFAYRAFIRAFPSNVNVWHFIDNC